jgi:UDP-N-acetylglucosamine/UDP-N-acetylgalactosamine diphosphorylase
MSEPSLVEQLQARGVLIHAPGATVIRDVKPDRIEPGVEIFPGCVIRGPETLLGRGTRLGRAGGGTFEDVRTGRDVDLYSGCFQNAVFLDGVIVRGHAEMRGGTLMEEESEAAHHVGYKMTITMPWVIAGSLVSFCDALVAGGTGRKDHTELGSCLALYNFTPRGDKHASLFGDVPRGVFLRAARIFVGGQCQVVSPVQVGYGAVLAAGCAVRRDVAEGQLYGEPARAVSRPFVPELYGDLERPLRVGVEYLANLRALDAWYAEVRLPGAAPFDWKLYQAARKQLGAGVAERLKRLDRLLARLPRSLSLHQEALAVAPAAEGAAWHQARIREHERAVQRWPEVRDALAEPPALDGLPGLDAVAAAFSAQRVRQPGAGYLSLVQGLDDARVAAGQADLQRVVDCVCAQGAALWKDDE